MTLQWTDLAKEDVSTILTPMDLDRALNFLTALESAELNVREHPLMYQERDVGARRPMRLCAVLQWALYYTIDEGEPVIRRMLHGAQNPAVHRMF